MTREARTAQREMGKERFRAGGLFPAGRVAENEFADALEGRRGRMPDAAAHTAVARLDMQVERRRFGLARALVEQARTGPGLVRGLVAGVADIAVDAEQRAALAARIGNVVSGYPRQRRLQVGDQLQERLAQVGLVSGLVG